MQGTKHAKPSQVSEVASELGSCISSVNDWCTSKRLQLNILKTEVMWYGSATNLRKLSPGSMLIPIGSDTLQPSNQVNDLGLYFDAELNMKAHVGRVAGVCYYHLRRLRALHGLLGQEVTARHVSAFVLSRLDYCNDILIGLPASTLAPLQRVMHAAVRLVCDLKPHDHISSSIRALHWLPIKQRIDFKESEVFEITDFTTASDWERFIARLEEQIHEWKLNSVTAGTPLTKGELTTGAWEEKSVTLHYADFSFVLTRYQLKQDGALPRDASLSDVLHAGIARAVPAAEEEDSAAIPIIWQDLMSSENAFPSRAHCLCRWYGLRDFVVLATAPHMDDITSESRIRMLLSSMSIAANNTACQVPMFLQTHSKIRRLYTGVAEFPGFRTSFEMVELKSAPHQYTHLAGLLDVFKSKVAAPVSVLPPVYVAVRLTYTLQDWTQYSWSQQPPDVDNFSGEVGITRLDELPFGAYDDPIVELSLSTTWPNLSEEMIIDNDVYSDLDPLQAPHWSLRARFTEKPQCLLGDYLTEFFKLCSRRDSVRQLLGRAAVTDDADVDMGKALQLLTERGPRHLPSLEKAVSSATARLISGHEEACIAADHLTKILHFLFPDAIMPLSKSSTRSFDKLDHHLVDSDKFSSSPASSQPGVSSDVDNQFKDLFKQLKSAPPSSLTSRLATCMCIINHSYGTPRAVAYLWQEFVLEMRYRWEKGYTIPDLESGCPHMGCSLLHQKLQMLNCCIERKRAREMSSLTSDLEQIVDSSSSSFRRSSSKSSDDEEDDNEDNDEFYECSEGSPVEKSLEKETSGDASPIEKIDCLGTDDLSKDKASDETHLEPYSVVVDRPNVSIQAEGRLKPHGNMRLLNVDECLYVPVTQEPAPMTEDMLEEHAEVLAKLGTSAEGTHLRARMQSACLLSDMEAFKAANPGSILGDFVRWYSPRDWIEQEVAAEDGVVRLAGELSQRMQIPGNMWLEVWQNAIPVPARRQRRLFDDTKEAEKVIHWLSSLTLSDIAVKLMPMLIHSAISRLTQHEECQLPVLRKLMTQITNKAMKATRSGSTDVRRFEDLIRVICQAEAVITRAQSLYSKFSREIGGSCLEVSDLQVFVSDLLDLPEVNIIGAARAPLASVIHRFFVNSPKADAMFDDDDEPHQPSRQSGGHSSEFPPPVGKEYILCTMINRPAPWSRPSPQRMYCVVTKAEFRLAGAFSTDTSFQ